MVKRTFNSRNICYRATLCASTVPAVGQCRPSVIVVYCIETQTDLIKVLLIW